MNGMQASVEQFHHVFGHPVADYPTLPSKEQAGLRVKLIQEELDENGEPVPHPTVPGKIGKSDLYSPPNLEPILEEMGWRE